MIINSSFHQTWYRGPPPGVDELIRFWARSAQRQGSKVNELGLNMLFYPVYAITQVFLVWIVLIFSFLLFFSPSFSFCFLVFLLFFLLLILLYFLHQTFCLHHSALFFLLLLHFHVFFPLLVVVHFFLLLTTSSFSSYSSLSLLCILAFLLLPSSCSINLNHLCLSVCFHFPSLLLPTNHGNLLFHFVYLFFTPFDCTVRAPVFGRHQFFGTSEHYGKAHGSLLSGWMNYNYTACRWFPTSSNILILPLQFWQIRFESYWLHCSKCRILVFLILRYCIRAIFFFSSSSSFHLLIFVIHLILVHVSICTVHSPTC